jgi:hypothetical protein
VAVVNGLRLTRDFVASSGRVLFFWVPESLRAEAAAVRAAVAKQLDDRLKKGKWVGSSRGADDDELGDEDEDEDEDEEDDDE